MNHSNKNANTDLHQINIDLLINVGSLAAFMILCSIFGDAESLMPMFAIGAAFTFIFMFVLKATYIYNVTMFFYRDRYFKKIFESYLIALLNALLLLFFATDIPGEDRKYVLGYLATVAVIMFTQPIWYKPLNKSYYKKRAPRVVLVGKAERFDKFRGYLHKTNLWMDIIGYVSVSEHRFKENSKQYIGWLEQLEDIIRDHHIDQVYIMQRHGEDIDVSQAYIDMCVDMGVTVKLIVDLYDGGSSSSYVSSMGTYPVITYHSISFNVTDQAIKRVVDVLASGLAIILTSPIMLATAIAVKLSSPGPILFKQTRVGQNGRHFKCLKFRSMYVDAEARKAELMAQNEIKGGVMFKMKDDPRITKVGKVIRKLSLDEFPQFFNVFIGDMSLVGTRPPTVDEVAKYGRNHWRRISIRPGITGMWQVNGRSAIEDFEEIVRLDTEYIDNWSLLLDIQIMFKTVAVLLKHSDSY